MRKKQKALPEALAVLLFSLIFPFVCIGGTVYCGFIVIRQQITGEPVPGFCGTGNRSARREWRIGKLLKKEAPRPLPSRRKRALTLPLSRRAIVGLARQGTNAQIEAIFFQRLPPEIREIVYSYALTSSTHVLHIFRRADRRLGHYRRRLEVPISYKEYQASRGLSTHQSATGAWVTATPCGDTASGLLPLLLTCRRT